MNVEQLVVDLGDWHGRGGPRYLRVADALEAYLDREGVADGARLPAERALADRLGLSRGTVVAAYAELADRGRVARRQGSGTTVTGARGPTAHTTEPRLPQWGGAAGIDLTFGGPRLDDAVGDLVAHGGDALAAGAQSHGYLPLGLPALRAAIAARAGAGVDPEDVIVTSGAQGAITLLAAAYLRPGDRVVVESPTFPGAVAAFSRTGATVVTVGRDHAGPRPDDLRRALDGIGASLVYLIPTCHNPTGSVMHEPRRMEIARILREHDATLVEDETLVDVVFDGSAPPSLAALGAGEVITLGSASKVLWGGLRVGWLRAPRRTALRLGRVKLAHDLGTGLLDQAAALAAFGRWDDVAAARRRQLAERHAVLSAAVADHLPDWEQRPVRGGYSLWVRLPHGTGDELAAAALARGVAVAPGTTSAPHDEYLDHVRLCFAAEPDVLREGVARLARAWADLGGRPAPAGAAIV